MKHIKSILSLFTLCLFGILYQCKHEQIAVMKALSEDVPKVTVTEEILPGSNDLLDKYLASSDFKTFCNQFSFEPSSYQRAETDHKATFFAIKIQHIGNTPSLTDYYLIVFPAENDYKTLVYEETYQGENINLSIFETNTYNYLAGRDLSQKYTDKGIVLDRTCYSENSGFWGCYSCGWNQLMSDNLSAAACIATLVVCDAAVTAHCLGLTS